MTIQKSLNSSSNFDHLITFSLFHHFIFSSFHLLIIWQRQSVIFLLKMDKNISLLILTVQNLCGAVIKNDSIAKIFQNLSQNFQSELPVTICERTNLGSRLTWISSTTAVGTCFIAAIGMVSTVLALLILSHESCNVVTYNYHRAINVADGIYMWFILERSISTMYKDISSKSLIWQTFDSIFSSKFDFALTDFVEWIVAWIAIERASMFFPYVLTTLNRKSATYGVIISSILISVSMNIPNGVAFSTFATVKNNITTYSFAENTFGKSPNYQIYLSVRDAVFIFRALVISVGTVSTIISMVMYSRRKRKLAARVGPGSTISTHLIAQIRTNQSLCALQLCESIPLIVFCCITVVRHSVIIILKPIEDLMRLSYDDAIQQISDQKYSLELEFAKAILGRTVHAIHFFLYILFTPKIRSVTARVFLRFNFMVRGNNHVTILPSLFELRTLKN